MPAAKGGRWGTCTCSSKCAAIPPSSARAWASTPPSTCPTWMPSSASTSRWDLGLPQPAAWQLSDSLGTETAWLAALAYPGPCRMFHVLCAIFYVDAILGTNVKVGSGVAPRCCLAALDCVRTDSEWLTARVQADPWCMIHCEVDNSCVGAILSAQSSEWDLLAVGHWPAAWPSWTACDQSCPADANCCWSCSAATICSGLACDTEPATAAAEQLGPFPQASRGLSATFSPATPLVLYLVANAVPGLMSACHLAGDHGGWGCGPQNPVRCTAWHHPGHGQAWGAPPGRIRQG